MSGFVPTGGLGNINMGHKGLVTSGERIVIGDKQPLGFSGGTITEDLGTYHDLDLIFVGKLVHTPIRPGSVRIVVKGADFVAPTFDDSKGNILGTRHLNGVINYSTGEVRLNVSPRAHDKVIAANYLTDFELAPYKSKLSRFVDRFKKNWLS